MGQRVLTHQPEGQFHEPVPFYFLEDQSQVTAWSGETALPPHEDGLTGVG